MAIQGGIQNAEPCCLVRNCLAWLRKKLCQLPQGWSKGTAEIDRSRVLQFLRQLAGTEEHKNHAISLRQRALPFSANVFRAHAVGGDHKDDRLRLIQRVINLDCPVATRCEMVRVQPSADPLPIKMEGE